MSKKPKEISNKSTIQKNIKQSDAFQEATGKIDYTLTNDYMFRAVLQENEKMLRGFVGALLRIDTRNIKSVTILNPIVLGKSFSDKDFVLDVKVMLNNKKVINLEMQKLRQKFWSNRSLSYLCAIFNNLEKGDDYSKVKPAYHIGILDFTPFRKYPEFYATNKIINVNKGYIYNDNFTLNVLDLKQIHLATDEDKAYKLDYWAKLFKASTWEDFKMLAQKDNVFAETGETVFKLNQDEEIRYLCEMREEGERITRTYTNEIARLKEKNKQTARAHKKEIAKKDAIIAEKDSALAKKDSALNKMVSEIDSLKAQLAALQQSR